MDISKLEQGMVVKNYKEMCKLLGEKECGGQSKKSQIKNWKCYFDFNKNGNKIIINEIYSEPKSKVDLRILGNNTGNYKDYNEFKVNKINARKKGVYSIKLNSDIYIGSTTDNFRNRFLTHIYKGNPLPTYNMLQNGAIYEVLWISNNNEDDLFIRDMERQYIKYYKNKPEWNVINGKIPYGKDGKTLKTLKLKYKNIKVLKSEYNKILSILEENNLLQYVKGE